VRAHQRVLDAAERTVEKITEQFLALLAIHRV
jgi:hypothetical protein